MLEEDLDAARDDAREEADVLSERHPRSSAVVRVAGGVLHEQTVERVGLAASGAAFWLVISALPTAIAVVSLYGLVVSPQRVAVNLGSLANGVPGSLGSLLTEQLERVAASNHAGLSFGFVVSIVLAVSSASAGVNHLDGAIRAAYGLPPQRYLEARGRATAGALVVVVLLGGSAVVLPAIGSRLSPVLTVVAVPIVLAALAAAIGGLYRFSVAAPLGARALPGAVAAAIGVVVVMVGFGAYVGVSSRYTAVYGAFAAR